jgi:hypothetical protein
MNLDAQRLRVRDKWESSVHRISEEQENSFDSRVGGGSSDYSGV